MSIPKKYWIVLLIIIVAVTFLKISIVTIFFGLAIIYSSIDSILVIKRLKRNGVHSAGRVVDYQENSEGETIPVIEFITLSGEQKRGRPYLFNSKDYSGIVFKDKSMQQNIPIIYDTGKPDKFIISTDRDINILMTLFFMIIGLASVILGILGLLEYVKMG